MGRACSSASSAVACAQLVSGVGLHDPHGLLRTDPKRLALSSGTQTVSSSLLPRYRDGSFVPRGPWREPSSPERRLLHAAGPPASIGGHITLVRVPDEVMAHFAALRARVRSCGSVDELRAWLDRHPSTAGCDAMVKFARLRLKSEQSPVEHGAVVCKAPASPTSTRDSTGSYVGLHVDHQYDGELCERANAPNRMSINLGIAARFFLYINLPLATIGALTVDQDPFDGRANDIRGLRTTFMSHFASYPVVRVRLDPGEGYIAPTENLIHDATKPDAEAPDVQFRVLGRFWPP